MKRLVLWTMLMLLPMVLWGQFNSGSNGSDGALNVTASGDFDPAALGLDADGDNVYHFTTINIANGVTLRLRSSKLRRPGPVVWLASGAVFLGESAVLDLNGSAGHAGGTQVLLRTPSEPGPGGYPGGAGAKPGDVPQRGAGSGGGNAGGCHAGYVSVATSAGSQCAGSGLSYGNGLLMPLVGGSGGGGGVASGTSAGGGGGAGGGAIRISSNVIIECAACTIRANGGGSVAGSGSGGAIHLQAPTISIYGYNKGGTKIAYVYAQGGSGSASDGRLRFDASSLSTSTQATIAPVPLTAPLVSVPLPAIPAVRITSVNGVAVSANPGNEYALPDVTTASTGSVPIAIAAQNVPVGTVLTLYLSTDTAGSSDQVVTTTALTGTLANSTATATVNLPYGVSRLFVRAVW